MIQRTGKSGDSEGATEAQKGRERGLIASGLGGLFMPS